MKSSKSNAKIPVARELTEGMPRTSSRENDANEDLLERAIRKLAPDRKALIGLRYKEGFSIEQIAEVLRIPEGTVKSRLHRTVNELQTLVEQESHE